MLMLGITISLGELYEEFMISYLNVLTG